jgi:prepilin-type processing-associated H-X9-DG protein
MRGVIKVGAVTLFLLVVVGLAATAVNAVRHSAAVTQCRNNIKSIAIGVSNYGDIFGHYPQGTVPNAALSPDRRLSWVTVVWPNFLEGGIRTLLDTKKAWDDPANRPPYIIFGNEPGQAGTEPVGEVPLLRCPAIPPRNDPSLPCPTHYLGVAGVGRDAAELPLSDRRAGFFGYDRKLSQSDIKDGLATTLMLVEASDGGPWSAGGPATVRGLSADGPYLGEGGQFPSSHRGGFFPFSQPVVTNVVFADGSVRPLTDSVSPQVLEALATVAGGDYVGPFAE